jgi:hypothetical protein
MTLVEPAEDALADQSGADDEDLQFARQPTPLTSLG